MGKKIRRLLLELILLFFTVVVVVGGNLTDTGSNGSVSHIANGTIVDSSTDLNESGLHGSADHSDGGTIMGNGSVPTTEGRSEPGVTPGPSDLTDLHAPGLQQNNTPQSSVHTLSSEDSYAESELLVRFKPGTPENEKMVIHGKFGASKIKDSRKLGSGIERVRLPPGLSVTEGKKRYKEDPSVVSADPNYARFLEESDPYNPNSFSLPDLLTMIPSDPSFYAQWGLHNAGQTGGTPDADIDAPEAWDWTTGSSSVVVAVFDTGMDYTHPDLATKIFENPGEVGFDRLGNDMRSNGLDDDLNGYIDDWHGYDFGEDDNNPIDPNGHGTHCAGVIGATGNNAEGVSGINWDVKILPCKISDANTIIWDDTIIEALNYANSFGVPITSNSYGGYDYSATLEAAFNEKDGMLHACAAGNYQSNNDVSPYYPASFPVPNIIGVAASDHNDHLASFSNYGITSVDLSAPGVNILSTYPRNSYTSMQGTSMATPHVAGVAALVKSKYTWFTTGQVRDALLNNVDHIDALKGIVATGGRLNAANSLRLPDRVGLFRDGLWVLDYNDNFRWDGTDIDRALSIGQAGDIPLAGDWNGDGDVEAGVFREGLWIFDYNGNFQWDDSDVDRAFSIGQAGDIPLADDWNGDGDTDIGVFRDGLWILDYNDNFQWDGPDIDRTVWLGQAGDIPLAGDWDGDGDADIGVFRDGLWIFDYNGNFQWDGTDVDRAFSIGQAGDIPLAGDWNGDGDVEGGVFRDGLWILDYNDNFQWDGPDVDRTAWLGQAGDIPLAGDWNADGDADIGVFRDGLWILDYNNNFQWDGTDTDRAVFIGQEGDVAVVGDW